MNNSGLPTYSTLLLLDGMQEKIHPFKFVTRESCVADKPKEHFDCPKPELKRQKNEFRRAWGPRYNYTQNIHLDHGVEIANHVLDTSCEPTDNLLLMENRCALVTQIYSRLPERQNELKLTDNSQLHMQLRQKQRKVDIYQKTEKYVAEEQMAVKRRHVYNWVLEPRNTFLRTTKRGQHRDEKTEEHLDNDHLTYSDHPVEIDPPNTDHIFWFTPEVTKQSCRYGDIDISRNKPQFKRKYSLRGEVVHLKNLHTMAQEEDKQQCWQRTNFAESSTEK